MARLSGLISQFRCSALNRPGKLNPPPDAWETPLAASGNIGMISMFLTCRKEQVMPQGKMRLLLSLFFLAGILSGPTTFVVGEELDDSEKAAIQKGLDSIQGTWEIVEAQHDGKDCRERYKKQEYKFTFHRAADTNEMLWGTGKNWVLRVNPSKLPKELDIITNLGADDGTKKVLRGIYELDEGVFRYCINVGQGDRPKRFSANYPQLYYTKLERVKSWTKD
jgi:uncharacterized protein (TIGR03067 family)